MLCECSSCQSFAGSLNIFHGVVCIYNPMKSNNLPRKPCTNTFSILLLIGIRSLRITNLTYSKGLSTRNKVKNSFRSDTSYPRFVVIFIQDSINMEAAKDAKANPIMSIRV